MNKLGPLHNNCNIILADSNKARWMKIFICSVIGILFFVTIVGVIYSLHPGRRVVSAMADVTPLHWAAWDGDGEKVKRLLDKNTGIDVKCKTGEVPLHYAAMNGHTEVVELLIERGANINAVTNSHKTPLHYAVGSGRADVVRLLLLKGANTNIKNIKGQTPLELARYMLSVALSDKKSFKKLKEKVKICEQILCEHKAD